MIGLLLAVSAVVPSLLIMHYFHARDRHREPRRVLWTAFGLGVLCLLGVVFVVPAAILVEKVGNPWAQGTLKSFFVAAFPEELLKLIVLYAYVRPHEEFDEPIDGLIYGAAVSLGFATLENILYVVQGGVGLAVLRAFTAVPMHAFGGAILGYYVARHKFEKKRGLLLEGYLIVVLLHGLYDTPLLILKALGAPGQSPTAAAQAIAMGGAVILSIGVVITQVLWARAILRRLRDEQDGPRTRRRQAEQARARALESGTGVAFTLLALGALLATVGGTFVLGMVGYGLFHPAGDVKAAGGGALLGTPPLVLGLVLFSKGLGRLQARVDAQRETWIEQADGPQTHRQG
jgi:hypothetical protein